MPEKAPTQKMCAFVKNTAGGFDGRNVKAQNTEYLQGFGGWPVLILDSLRTACNGMKQFEKMKKKKKMTETASARQTQKFAPFFHACRPESEPYHNHQFPFISCYERNINV